MCCTEKPTSKLCTVQDCWGLLGSSTKALQRRKSSLCCALPRNFATMKNSSPAWSANTCLENLNSVRSDFGIIIRNQDHDLPCNANPSFASHAGMVLSRLAQKHLRMDALFNRWLALIRAHEHWERAFSCQNLRVKQGWCSNSGLISTPIN